MFCFSRGFYKECPTGEVDKQKMLDMYRLLLPPGNARVFVEQLFGLFDTDKGGTIDFKVKFSFHLLCSLLLKIPGIYLCY